MGLDCTIYAVSGDKAAIYAKEQLDRLYAFWPMPLKPLGQGYRDGALVLGPILKDAILSAPIDRDDRHGYIEGWRDAAVKFINEAVAEYGERTLFGIYGEEIEPPLH